ncbi:MAG: sensor histidine kinase [Eubacteriales bacterium]|nr:sensor histidine kinase [Eubacteriales bacterium]
MKFSEYLKDKVMVLLFQGLAVIVSFVYLKICGLKPDQLFFIYMVWFMVLVVYMGVEWYRRKKFFDEIFHTLGELKEPYLISEIMPYSYRLEDKLYAQILKFSNKSVVDAVRHLEREQAEYKEFIENWIHEVKLPITAMNLICDNVKNDETRRIKLQLNLLENDVEKALFYARSDRVYQDYFIRQIRLDEVVYEVIERNQMYLRMNQMGIDVEVGEVSVYCDDKWLAFILSQLLINGVKYRRERECRIVIRAMEQEGRTILIVEDNGIGIKASELGRVFQKGFTGTNGRQNRQSTGIGLYLCKKLCRKLDMGIDIQSEEGKYTRVVLGFPDGSEHFGRGYLKKT